MMNKRTSGLNKKGVLLTLSLTGALIPSIHSSAAGSFSEFWKNLSFSGVCNYLRSLGSRRIDFLFNFFSGLVGRSAPNALGEGPKEEEHKRGPLSVSRNQDKDTSGKIFSGDNLQREELYQVALKELKGENGEISKNKDLLGSLLEEVKKGLGEDISSKMHLEYNESESLFKGTVEILGKKIPVVFVGIEAGDIVGPNFLVYKRHLGPGKPTRKSHDEKEMLEETINAFKEWYTAVESIFDYCGKLAKTGLFDVDRSQEGKGKLTFRVKKEYKIFLSKYGEIWHSSEPYYTFQVDELVFDVEAAIIYGYSVDIIDATFLVHKSDAKYFSLYNEKIVLENLLNNVEKIKNGERVKIFANEESDGATTSV